jgi:hypothetical protein
MVSMHCRVCICSVQEFFAAARGKGCCLEEIFATVVATVVVLCTRATPRVGLLFVEVVSTIRTRVLFSSRDISCRRVS